MQIASKAMKEAGCVPLAPPGASSGGDDGTTRAKSNKSNKRHRRHRRATRATMGDRMRDRPLVLDVGANMGWFSLLAASSGCR